MILHKISLSLVLAAFTALVGCDNSAEATPNSTDKGSFLLTVSGEENFQIDKGIVSVGRTAASPELDTQVFYHIQLGHAHSKSTDIARASFSIGESELSGRFPLTNGHKGILFGFVFQSKATGETIWYNAEVEGEVDLSRSGDLLSGTFTARAVHEGDDGQKAVDIKGQFTDIDLSTAKNYD